jgi:methionyl-tRNA synthetase
LLVGSDEHTVLMPRHALKEGIDLGSLLDERARRMGEAWKRLRISHDGFVRTSEPRHKDGCRVFLERLYNRGLFKLKRHEGPYCENCEAYKDPGDLKDGCCENHPGVPAITVRETNWAFPLPAFRDRLLALHREQPGFIEPAEVRDELLRALERGLSSVPMTREGADWGIPAPFDPSRRIYVWVDALLSYLTAAGHGEDEVAFRGWWPAAVQVIGRDIAWFHGVLWPALLMAAGLPPPRRIVVHGLIRNRGVKMSKTIGNVVDALDLVDRYGVDALRYYLLRECPFTGSGSFSDERFAEVYARDLEGALGRLHDRTVSLAASRGNEAAEPGGPQLQQQVFGEGVARLINDVRAGIERWEYDRALAAIWERAVQPALRYQSSGAAQVAGLADALRVIAIMLKPFLPDTAERLYGVFVFPVAFSGAGWDDTGLTLSASQLNPGRAPAPLFPAPPSPLT